MFKITLLVFLFSLSAQTLPSTWVGTGASFNPSSHPQAAGWFSYATTVKPSVYSFTTYDILVMRRAPYTTQASIRTGLATILRRFGPATLLGFGDAGMVAGSIFGGAFSGGGLLVYPVGKKGLTIEGGVRIIHFAGQGQQNVYEIGVGQTFK